MDWKSLGWVMLCVMGAWLALESVGHAAPQIGRERGETELFREAQTAAQRGDWEKANRVLLLWKERFPESKQREERQEMLLQSFENLRQTDKMWEAARELVQLNPKSQKGLHSMTVLAVTAPERWEEGEKAAGALLANLGGFFGAEQRPPGTSPARFQQEKVAMETAARRTLGWVAMMQKESVKAEEEFTALLKANPGAGGQISYWLATAMLAQRRPDKQSPAIWHFARAAYILEGESLAPEGRQQVQDFVQRTCANFMAKDEFQEFVDGVLRNPFPPKGFAIEVREVARRDPPRKEPYEWERLKRELAGPNGLNYFESTLKGAALPWLRGRVVAATPADRPKEVMVSMSPDGPAEIKLRLGKPLDSNIEKGTEIDFEGGVAVELTVEPFLLTLDQKKEQVRVLPGKG